MDSTKHPAVEKVPFHKTLRGRLLFQFLGFTIIPILIMGILAYSNAQTTLLEKTSTELNAIADFKQKQLENWIGARQADTNLIASNSLNRDHIAVFLDLEKDPELRKNYRDFTIENFKSLQEEREGYLEILFVNIGGSIILSTDPNRINTNLDNPELIINTISATFGKYTQDIFFNSETNQHEMIFSQIMYKNDDQDSGPYGEILGILLIRISMEDTLYPILSESTSMGEALEVLLSKKQDDQAIILNPLKATHSHPLSIGVPFDSDYGNASKLALNGYDGFGNFKDYRQEPVYAAYRPISDMNWGFVIKQDTAEVYQPLIEGSLALISALFIAIIISIYASYTQAKKTSEPLSSLVKAARQIAQGNYQTEISSAATGEYQALTDAFNAMTEAVLNRDAHLRAHSAEVETLFALSQEFTGITDKNKILNLALEYCQLMLENDYCMIYVQDDDCLPLVGHTSPIWDEMFSDNLEDVYQYGCQIAAPAAILEKTPIRTNNLNDDPRFPSQLLRPVNMGLASITVPMLIGTKAVGAFWILSKDDGTWDEEHLHLVSLVANQTAVAIERANLVEDLIKSYDQTLDALATALDARDHETEGHSRRVVAYTLAIAKEFGVPEDKLPTIQRGALLHDIGKIGVPDAILHKPDRLDDEEFEIMKTHPTVGKHILDGIPQLKEASEIVYTHHERWQGQGYPDGLKKQQIPLGARIFGVADTFDAITSDRPYRTALPYEYAVKEIKAGKGTQFDPEIVDAFLRIPKEVWDSIKKDTLTKANDPSSSLVLPEPLTK